MSKAIVKSEKEVSGMVKDSEGLPCHKMVITTCDLEPGESISPTFLMSVLVFNGYVFSLVVL